MCGIVGFIDYSKSSSQEILKKMCDTLAHRGPDAQGLFFEQYDGFQIGLGHQRLSIIDIETCSNQPLFYEDWVIIFNGEIYNYNEIRERLIAKGRHFSTNSDTEVILQSFDEWGQSCIDQFIGMFAFVLFNRQTKEIYTVRDRVGVKPLFIYHGADIIMWASQPKSFHQHPAFKKELNLESVKSYVQLGYVPFPNSIFKNVSKHRAGGITHIQIESRTEEKTTYWDSNSFYSRDISNIDYPTAKRELKDLLRSAFNYRMISDVPVGVFLSGGYDSTLVTAMLQSDRTDKIKTFTISVDDPKINEGVFAKETASILGTDHTDIRLSENELFLQFENIADYYDEPFGDESAIPTMLVCKEARKSVTVALSADGGDELFAGYNRYDHISKLGKIRRLRKIPFAKSLIPLFIGDDYQKERIKSLLNEPDAITLARVLNTPFYLQEVNRLFLKEISDRQVEAMEKTRVKVDDLRQMLAFDYQTYLLNDILVKMDRASMRYSLEAREPLLDHRLLEFAATLPNEFKIKDGIKKYILRDIVHDYVPKSKMDRPKMGFAPPIESWLHHQLKDKVEYYFSETFIKSQNIFSYQEIERIKNDYYEGKNKYAIRIWYLLIFQMWYERWMR